MVVKAVRWVFSDTTAPRPVVWLGYISVITFVVELVKGAFS